jgi:thioredoxin 2
MSNTTTSRHATVSCPFCSTLNHVDLSRLGEGPRCGTCRRPLLLDRPVAVPGESFDRILADAEVPFLVDCYADWCGPCRIMAPVLDEFAHDRTGEVLVGKLDTDRYPEVAQRLGVRGIPTLILFSGGREVARQVGAVPRAGLEALFDSVSTAPKSSA